MDETDNFFDCGGTRAEVVAALDASMAASPTGVLHAAKTFASEQIAALPDQWMGVTIRWNAQPAYGFTIVISYSTAPSTP